MHIEKRNQEVPVRIPNSEYGRNDLDEEMEEERRGDIEFAEQRFSSEERPEWIGRWKALVGNIRNATRWEFLLLHLYEVTRLLPGGFDRSTLVDTNESICDELQQDIDTWIEDHIGLDRYMYFYHRLTKLMTKKRESRYGGDKLSKEEEMDMGLIQLIFGVSQLEKLYIQLRQLGWSRKDLRTARGA